MRISLRYHRGGTEPPLVGISTSPSLLLHFLEAGGRVSPLGRVRQQRGPHCSPPYLEESVQQEGKPVGQHLLGHRLGPGEAGGDTSHTEPPSLCLAQPPGVRTALCPCPCSAASPGGAGDSRDGDSQPGDSRDGDSRTGDSKAGDSRTGDSRVGDSQPGDTRLLARGANYRLAQ